jgi:hypothetical protein
MKTVTIGLPCTPSKNISKEEMKVTEILVSWGGGMGGSSQRLYGKVLLGATEECLVFQTIQGEEIEIGTKYIVTKKSVTLVKIVTDVTAHWNYTNIRCKEAIETEYILKPFDVEFVFNFNNYSSRTELKSVYRYTDQK